MSGPDDLAGLAAEADNLSGTQAGSDFEPAAGDLPPAGEYVPRPADEIAAMLSTVALLLAPLYPSVAAIYTPETCKALGDAAAPVLEKYGVSVGGLFDRWGAEITLASVAVPVALQTMQAIRADLKKPEKKSAPAAAEPPPGEGIPPGAMILHPPAK